MITSDSTLCLPEIPHCSAYETSSSTSKAHTCSTCADGFVYSTANNLCEAPSSDILVENCAKYQNDNGGCTSCKNHFYLDNSKCVQHRFVPDCLTYSGSQAHTCSTCHLGFVLMSSAQQCLQGTLIPNCLRNLTETTCSECSEGFYGTLCSPIPISLKCLKVNPSDNSLCLKCMPGHYLESGICRSAEDFELRYCETLGVHSCNKCKPFSVLAGLKDFAVCQPRSQNASIPSLCVRFDPNNGQCLECQSSFFLDNNKCSKFCPPARSSVVLRQYTETDNILSISAVNKCIDGASESNALCQVFVPDSRDPTKLVCAKCKRGTVPGTDPSTLSHHMFMLTESDSIDSVPVDHSLTSPGLTCLSDSNLDLIENCELWTLMSGQKYCTKCRYGYKGQIKKTSSDSHIEKCVKDFNCSRTKLPFSSGLSSHTSFQNLYPKSVPSALLSCYFCSNNSEIPFLYAANSASGLTLTNFDKTETTKLESSSATTDDFSFECHNPSTFKFYNSASSFVSGFPSFCAYGLIDPSKNISTNGASTYLQCLACENGYKPIFTGNYISSCSLISFCDQSWEFGQCSLCLGGYVWKYDDSNKFIDKTECIPFADR